MSVGPRTKAAALTLARSPALSAPRKAALRCLRATWGTRRPVLAMRTDLPHLLDRRGLLGCGVEVGVKAGAFSERLLDHWGGRHLVSVDPWASADPDERYVNLDNVAQDVHDGFHAEAIGRLRRFGGRSSVWRMAGRQAASQIPHHTLDFVYLDARHDYESVRDDLEDWYPKLRPGGILAGHDYVDGTFVNGEFGVRSAGRRVLRRAVAAGPPHLRGLPVGQLVRHRRMTRVLFTHRYSMELIRSLCATGKFPRQHLGGADALQRAGFEVEYGFFGRNRRALTHLSWRLGGKAGDLEEQAAILRRTGPDTVVYAGEASLLSSLARLRRAGWRVPVVAVVHTPDRSVAGLDVAVCLSARTRDRLVRSYGRDPALTPLAAWGPDLGFPGYTATGEEIVISAGKTDRDVDTLLRALEQLDLPARVYADRPPRPGPVEIVATGTGPPLPYSGVLDDLRRASNRRHPPAARRPPARALGDQRRAGARQADRDDPQ